jgi:hypothetical protein
MYGLELGASNLLVAYSPFGEKIVQWTILREAREKQVRPAAPKEFELDLKVQCELFFVVNI